LTILFVTLVLIMDHFIVISSKIDCPGAKFALPKSGPVGMTLNGQVCFCSDNCDIPKIVIFATDIVDGLDCVFCQ
jgi:hypothetical protein